MTGKHAILGLAAVVLASMSAPMTAKPPSPSVHVETGVLEGTDEGGVLSWKGIPFAAPPVGPDRWHAPRPAPAWAGVRSAKAFGANCMQDDGPTARNMPPWTPEYMIQGAVSEDCLFLNVWAPARRTAQKLPVMVWIHGGAFRSGGGDVPVYDGRNLAARGIIVVTLNYRLGVYGFLAHPLLTAEAGTSGNYGLLDQIAALQWVKRNIGAFGGDPAKVTIAGQSAGAASVHDLILSPLAKGLFVRAIAQSGSGMGIPLDQRPPAEAGGAKLGEALGATSLAALRALTPAQLVQAERKAGRGFSPIADGVVLPADPAAALAAGHYNDTPVLTGYVADEGNSFGPRPSNAGAFSKEVGRRYGRFADRFLAAYPVEKFPDSAAALSRDRTVASMLLWANDRRKTSHSPIYAYLFTHVEPGPDSARFGAFHSSEIPYVFGTLDKAPQRGFVALDRTVSDWNQSYWANFVKSGNPRSSGLAAWPKLDDRMMLMEFGSEAKARPAMSAEQLRLFTEYVAAGGRLGLF
jgi:para-nitrobenzyl esterase